MIALLSALQAELYHVHKRIEEPSFSDWAGMQITTGKIADRNIVSTWTGAGIAQSALTTQYICSRFQPDLILFGGIGGALTSNLDIGDFVIAKDAVQWDIDTSAVGGGEGVFPGRRPDGSYWFALETDANLSGLLEKTLISYCQKCGRKNRVCRGRFLSGDTVFSLKKSAGERSRLQEKFHGEIVDMESSSVVLAGRVNRVPTAVVRMVSDIPRVESQSSRHKGQLQSFREVVDMFSLSYADICETFLSSL